jgi:AraC family transcriptional regulator
MTSATATANVPMPLIEAVEIASGADWRVRRVVCRAGPESPVAEERHAWTGVAVVASGTFNYRSNAGSALLAPGALLLANAGACFECGHAHATGDTCISFQYGPALVESAFARYRHASRHGFRMHVVPPVQATLPLTARAGMIERLGGAIEELAMQMLDLAIDASNDDRRQARPDTADEARVATLARDIDRFPADAWTLDSLCARSGLDRFRLLRAFRRATGTTPYQYVLRQRLEAAARALLRERAPVQHLALACGFNDLSEFNRRFRRYFGVSPTVFRRTNA